jgi:hypothetical protein
MAYARRYFDEFNTRKGNKVALEIHDESGLTPVQLTVTTLKYEDADGDFDKLAGVKRSVLRFGLLLDSSFNYESFFTSNDTDYKVLLYINDTLTWAGWLDAANMTFRLIDAKQEIELVAKDGLHLLDSAKFLEQPSDSTPWAFYRITNIISYCLDKTELGLNFRNWIDIYPDGATVRALGFPERDPFYITFLNSGTFRTGPNDYESPIEILNKICISFGMRLFQARGEWHLVYVEDWIKNDGLTCSRFDSAGTPVDVFIDQRHRIQFGKNQTLKLINEDAQVSFTKPYKSVQSNFNYDVPQPVLRNEDLNSGAFVSFESPASIARYNLDNWSQAAGWSFHVAANLEVINGSLTEKFRYIQCLTDGISSSGEITSTAIPVQGGDMFQFDFNVAAGDAPLTNKWRLFIDVKLTSNSPIVDKWLGRDGKWKTTRQFYELTTALNGVYFSLEDPFRYNYATIDPIPSGGNNIEIIFRFEESRTGVIPSGTKGIRIFDFDFQYTPSINEYASTARGHYHRNETTGVKENVYEIQRFINDAPNYTMRGALISGSGVLRNFWFHNGVTESLKLGKLLNRSAWKCYHRTFYRLEGVFNSATDGNYLISPLNTLTYNEGGSDTLNNKEFIITTLRSVDVVNETAEGTFVELLNTSNTNDYDAVGTETFKILSLKEKRLEPEKSWRNPPAVKGGFLAQVIYDVGQLFKKR